MGGGRIDRVLIIGLDCAAPRFLFDRDGLTLPAVHGLMDRGCWGPLRSCDPPITLPAWTCMASGKDAGTLGVYGFRNRRDHAYGKHVLATGADVRERRLWDYVGEAGGTSVVLGVPQTYPPSPLKGVMVSGLLTPDTERPYTYPAELARELEEHAGGYQIDVADFRTAEREDLAARLQALMHNRFDVAEYLVRKKPWSLFMMVEIGLDRIHHAFWQESDPDHPSHRAGSPLARVIPDYYRALDTRVGRLLAIIPDRTAVLIVSDHGAQAMRGGFAINQWLMERGYLALKETPAEPLPLSSEMVDWQRTRAWGEGGYYGRIYVNVAGREPQGTVAPAAYEAMRDNLRAELEALVLPDGRPMGNRLLKPQEIYATVNGVAPDLMGYFGNLAWRSVGRVGGGVFWEANDTGPDGANHDFTGVFIMDDGKVRNGGPLPGLSLFDVTPTVLSLLGIPRADGMLGRDLSDAGQRREP